MKICIVGAGYVGLSLAVLISRKYKVSLLDINKQRVSLLNKKISPISDDLVKNYLKTKKLDLHSTSNPKVAFKDSDFIVIATPTNFIKKEGSFDTSSVKNVIRQAKKYSARSYIIIKSTVPVGFTNQMRSKFKTKKITFSPEFCREGVALFDNLRPSRIVIGGDDKKAKIFGKILLECSELKRNNKQIYYVSSSEAEAIKLFSNTYLAMRVAFFNELDTFSQVHKISAKNIVDGVSADPRIGNYYNNPSFGYGGYCLPKDTKQLLSNFSKIPGKLIKSIIESNKTRKNFMIDTIIKKKPKTIGVFRLEMKTNSDNFRESAILDIVVALQKKKFKILLYEPSLDSDYCNMRLENNLKLFISKSDLIIANRYSRELKYSKKIYTRDIFGRD